MKTVLGGLAALLLLLAAAGPVGAQELVWPWTYNGSATAAGAAVPNGYVITAGINDYRSPPAEVENGRYTLTMAPPSRYVNKTVVFYIGSTQAAETDTYRGGALVFKRNFDLTFPVLPEPTPTPTPTPDPQHSRHGNACAYCDAHPDGDAHCHAHRDADADAHADAHADPNSRYGDAGRLLRGGRRGRGDRTRGGHARRPHRRVRVSAGPAGGRRQLP